MKNDIEVTMVDTLRSTSTYMKEHADAMGHGSVVATHCQTAGRGQRGNSWEAEPGRNITMSLMLEPLTISAREQFVVSEIVSVALVRLVRRMLRDVVAEERVSVKWPNDIYVDDSKICGILIENSLQGTVISKSVVGIGLNINQERFLSDAPNPVSVINYTGVALDVDAAIVELAREVLSVYEEYAPAGRHDELHRQYRQMMWRRTGSHPYRDAASGERFMATISDVEPTGHLILRDTRGPLRRYAFKEVHPVM